MNQKSDIPNSAGYMFELIRPDGSKQIARVAVEPETGCHYAATPSGKKIDLAGFAGWQEMPKPYPVPGHVPRGSAYLWTRDQLVRTFAGWNITEQAPPAKGKAVLIAFPPVSDLEFAAARVTVAEGKSTDGKTLYACQYYSKIA